MATVLTLDNINVDGKTVLVRIDINSPLDPSTKALLDDTRIRAILPTINRLSKAKTVLIAHQSRPGKNDFTSTLGHARELGRLLGRSIKWVQDIHGEKAMKAIEAMEDGDILMLNNIRMDPEEVGSKGDSLALSETTLVQDLASVADVFVNDAFGAAHRAHASTQGVTNFLSPSVAGFLLEKELKLIPEIISDSLLSSDFPVYTINDINELVNIRGLKIISANLLNLEGLIKKPNIIYSLEPT